jgi:hypothetical protein
VVVVHAERAKHERRGGGERESGQPMAAAEIISQAPPAVTTAKLRQISVTGPIRRAN